MSIIDRDIQFYEGEVDRAKDALARCTPGNEPYYQERIEKAQDVVQALTFYREVLGC